MTYTSIDAEFNDEQLLYSCAGSKCVVFDLDKNNLYLHTANDNPRIVLEISN